MEDLHSIKRKLETYKKMKQMTDALKITAITGYSSFSKRIIFVKNFLSQISQTTAILINKTNKEQAQSLISAKNVSEKKSLIIVIGATKELGSGFFGALKNFFPKIFKPTSTLSLDCITIGKSAKRAILHQNIENLNIEIIKEIKEFGFKQAISIANDITKFIFENQHLYKECSVINLRFKSLLSSHKNYKLLFPVLANKEIEESRKNIITDHIEEDFIMEQEASVMVEDLSMKFISSSLLYEIIESLTAESAARYLAMDKAVINAEKCITEMTQQMNKARQVLITKQITEIACYAELGN